MPGGTKLSTRWQPDLYLTNREQWKHLIRKFFTYSNEVWCRYGFLETVDLFLLLLPRTKY